MKNNLLLLFALLLTGVAFTQTITINSIGMHGPSGAGDFEIEENEEISLKVNYTVSGLTGRNQIKNYSFDDNTGQIQLTFYTSETPNEDDWVGDQLYLVPINSNSVNGTHDIISTINIGLVPVGSVSFQANLAINPRTGTPSAEYSSHQEDLYYGTIVPLNSPPTGYSTYLTVFNDVATDAPVLYTPDSSSAATLDNNTLLIDFQLTEPAFAGSVKLYFSPNSDGSSPTTTLTLATAMESTDRHQIELNPSAFSAASPYIYAISGATSLTHLNTYYIAIGYQDKLQHDEAKSPWHMLIYDNTAIKPRNVSVSSSNVSSDFNVHFTLDEDSQEDGITIYVKNETNNAEVASIQLSGVYSTGSHTVILNGSNLSDYAHVLAATGDSGLLFGVSYKFAVKIEDLAGNIATSNNSAPFQYNYSDTTISATAAEYNPNESLAGYNSGAYQPIGYVFLETASSVASLSEISFDVGGTLDADDASHLILYASATNDFSSATTVSGSILFNGTAKYTFTVNNNTFSAQGKYYFVAISLDTGLSYDDNITLSTNSDYISTSGTMNTFTSSNFAEKYLYKSIIVNYFDYSSSSITPGAANAPFFRLDLRTNDSKTLVTSLKLDISGTLTANDVENKAFRLWKSNFSNFDAKTATAIEIGDGSYFGETIQFSGFSEKIDSVVKYYFFTVTTKSNANTAAVIGGSVQNATYITSTTDAQVDPVIGLIFPINGAQQTLPVELSSFTATLTSGNAINVKWTVESETGLSGYYIFRSATNDFSSAYKIPVLIHSVNTSQTYTYSFLDREIDLSQSEYYYWLMTVELSNESETFGPIMVKVEMDENDTPSIDLGTVLIGNYPNPFNPTTSISFSLEKPEDVVIDIYNIKGQLVRNLYNEKVTTINQRIDVLWDGNNNNGTPVASGVYYTKMIAGKHSDFKKMLLMK